MTETFPVVINTMKKEKIMKALVTYFTQTGNTKKIAEAVFSAIDCDKTILPMKEVTSIDGYDVIFIGFPVWNFGPAEPAKKFLFELCKGKNTALLVTHAMPCNSEDAGITKQLGAIMRKCTDAAAGTGLLGVFDCQGELSRPVADFLLKSDNEQLKNFGAMRNETAGHPDDKDINLAVDFTKEIMKKIS